jgi:hypothetical protein
VYTKCCFVLLHVSKSLSVLRVQPIAARFCISLSDILQCSAVVSSVRNPIGSAHRLYGTLILRLMYLIIRLRIQIQYESTLQVIPVHQLLFYKTSIYCISLVQVVSYRSTVVFYPLPPIKCHIRIIYSLQGYAIYSMLYQQLRWDASNPSFTNGLNMNIIVPRTVRSFLYSLSSVPKHCTASMIPQRDATLVNSLVCPVNSARG